VRLDPEKSRDGGTKSAEGRQKSGLTDLLAKAEREGCCPEMLGLRRALQFTLPREKERTNGSKKQECQKAPENGYTSAHQSSLFWKRKQATA
jgi:hypothetical protein